MTRRIYLDHAATTPLRPEAREAMAPWLEREFGNASSLYEEGRRAKEAIDAAREVVANALGCLFGEVVFTSSGTEACNLAMVGSALATTAERNRFLVPRSEHHAVVNTRPVLERLGMRIEDIDVDEYGRPDVEDLRSHAGSDIALMCAMYANNETGAITSVKDIAPIAHSVGAIFFVDAVQAFPWCDGAQWTVEDLGADIVALSAHKLGGPKGVGALYIKAGTAVKPTTWGGGQEREMRAGTEDVAAIVGFATAVQGSLSDLGQDDRKRAARDAFRRALIEEDTPKLHLQTLDVPTLPGHCHLRFEGVNAESLLILLDRMGVAASAGAACSSGSIEPSHVLLACGWTEEQAREGVRFTFGYGSSVEDAIEAAQRVAEAARNIARDS